MPAHARAMLDDLFAARDTIDSLISGIERFYGAIDAPTPAPARRAQVPKLAQPDMTPWVAPEIATPKTNGHASTAPQTPSATVEQAGPRHRHDAILHALRLGPPVGLSCAEIVHALYPGARSEERKKLTSAFWTTLQAMTKTGVLVEDSRLYTIASREGAATS